MSTLLAPLLGAHSVGGNYAYFRFVPHLLGISGYVGQRVRQVKELWSLAALTKPGKFPFQSCRDLCLHWTSVQRQEFLRRIKTWLLCFHEKHSYLRCRNVLLELLRNSIWCDAPSVWISFSFYFFRQWGPPFSYPLENSIGEANYVQ